MSNADRRTKRLERRKRIREAKKEKVMKKADKLETVADINNLIKSFKHSSIGVTWKHSVQKYDSHLLSNVVKLNRLILSGRKVSEGFHHFTIFERGKARQISSVCIRERVAQRSLCCNSLIPALTRSLIYDNGASLKGKGISFAIKRLKRHMVQHYRKYGSEGYVLRFDLKSYFANIDHEVVRLLVEETYKNEALKKFIMGFVYDFEEGGLGLGSEISQIFAIALPNHVDHYIKEVLKVKAYGRYMDDLYLIHHNKEYLQECYHKIVAKLNDLHIIVNTKKTNIIPLKNGVPFLKTLFFYTNTGKIILKPDRSSVIRQRRKLKKFKKFYTEGKMSLNEIQQSYNSWRGFISHKNARWTIFVMDKMVRREFGTFLDSHHLKRTLNNKNKTSRVDRANEHKTEDQPIQIKPPTINDTRFELDIYKSRLAIVKDCINLETKTNTTRFTNLLVEKTRLEENIKQLERYLESFTDYKSTEEPTSYLDSKYYQ